jgi:hypothetical protein
LNGFFPDCSGRLGETSPGFFCIIGFTIKESCKPSACLAIPTRNRGRR